MISAGRLDQRATLQQPVKTRAASGEELVSYETVATRWVSVNLKGGKEDFTGIQLKDVQRYELKLRYDSEIAALSPEWQIIIGSVTLNVITVENIGLQNGVFKVVGEVIG